MANMDTVISKKKAKEFEEIEIKMAMLKKRREELHTELMEKMNTKGITKVVQGCASVAAVAARIDTSFDKTTFGKDYPELLDKYTNKPKPVSASLRVSIPDVETLIKAYPDLANEIGLK